MKNRVVLAAVLTCLISILMTPTASAQDNVPHPDPEFKGKIGKTFRDSQADPKLFLPRSAPEDAPNILLVLIDDAGFGASSTFGGPCQTPGLTKLAKNGLRYNRFHTTAVCSPTRAALLTGHNHHSAGTGIIMEMLHRISRLHGDHSAEHRIDRRDPARQRLHHCLDRQEPQRRGHAGKHGGPARPLAEPNGI